MKKKEKDIIKYGFNNELDEYLDISKFGKQWIVSIEAMQREYGTKRQRI